jgi:hypothetical protein
MALFTAAEVRSAFKAQQPHLEYKSADMALFKEQIESIDRTGQEHDVFISYSHLDEELVLGVVYILRNRFRLRVYVDRDDTTLSPDDVEVATQLKRRMRYCLSLVYIASDNDARSHWTPWELGFFDGFRGTVAVLPITEQASTQPPHDRPYLRIYPYLDATAMTLWVNDRKGGYRNVKEWLRDGGQFAAAAAR